MNTASNKATETTPAKENVTEFLARKQTERVEARRLAQEKTDKVLADRRAAAVATGKAPAGSVVCPCCSRAVKVVGGRVVRHGQRGGVNGSTGPAATGMRIHNKTTAPCEGSGRAV